MVAKHCFGEAHSDMKSSRPYPDRQVMQHSLLQKDVVFCLGGSQGNGG